MTQGELFDHSVTLVIPGRNCAATLDRCLASVVPLKDSGQLQEIIFVDDGSTDQTAEIAAKYSVRIVQGTGQGPGAARNLGWRAAQSELIWFIDSDCVAEPDALEKLLPHMTDPAVAGVGGSYSNLYPDSLVATLIHEEIIARHRRMPEEVNFLATFNVLYRRAALKEVDGFDESLKLAQDAELAFRIDAAGHRLRFEVDSLVGHHHPRSWRRYLRTQYRQGYYRVMLYRRHTGRISGDSYAGLPDYLQPPLALIAFPSLVLLGLKPAWPIPIVLWLILLILPLPIVMQMFRNAGPKVLVFPVLAAVRSLSRGLGLLQGLVAVSLRPERG